MNSYDIAFNEQIEFLLQEFRDRNITVHQLMDLIKMAYGDYLELHPKRLPESQTTNHWT